MRVAHASLVAAAIAAGVCGAIACGRITDDGDAGPDSGPDAPLVPCTGGPFVTISPLVELNTSDDDRDLRFTPDERLAIFARPLSDGGLGNRDLYWTQRDVRSDPLSPPSLLTELYPGLAAVHPSITADGQFLFYESFCNGGYEHNASPLCYAVPDGGPATFSGSVPVLGDPAANNGGDTAPGPFGASQFGDEHMSLGDGFVTADAGAYYFAARTTPEGAIFVGDADAEAAGQAIFVMRPMPEDGAVAPFPFSPPAELQSGSGAVVDNPVPTEDELTVFVSVSAKAEPTPHIYVATRATTSESFGAFAPLHELDSPEGEYPSWISPDRCRLYLSRKVGGQWDIYLASRSP